MKTFSQFINESSDSSLLTKLFTELVEAIEEQAYGAKYVSLNPDLSIEIKSEWELDTMKISGLGRVEPIAHYRTKIIPDLEKADSDQLNRLIQLGLSSRAAMIKGFTIVTSLDVQVEEVYDFEFTEGPDETYYSIDELEDNDGTPIASYLEADDVEGAAGAIVAEWDETANGYGYMLYTRVAEDLEQFIAERNSEEEDEEDLEEEGDESEETLESRDNFTRLHQLGLADTKIEIENLDGDQYTDHQIKAIEADARAWTDWDDRKIVSVEGQLNSDIIMLIITLSDGSIIQIDTFYETGPGYSNRDYANMFVKNRANREFNIELKKMGKRGYSRADDEDLWMESLEDTGSIIKSTMHFAKRYL